ncbi:MAG TPA: carboxyl-terminal protease [Verrucomicrobiales bacterium]|nr:carboxyl-terminal protease [Verrucomicrobiales bacterium]
MKRRLLYGTLLTLLALNILVGAQIYLHGATAAAEGDDPYTSLKLFTTVLERVRSEYVDNSKLSYKDLVHAALKGMLSTLDPHSEFMDPPKYQDLKNDTSGEFGGVGIVVSMKSEFLTVVSPMEDTPGYKAGILSGDRIIKIDGHSTDRLGLPDAVKRLRGEPGSEVSLTILRPSNGQVKDYKLVRAAIKVDTVKDVNGKREYPVDDHGIGYVRLTQFGERTADELSEALRKLKDHGMKALVMDLRGNPGGLLDQAVEVCEKFLPRGELVVTTEGREGKQKSEYRARGGDKLSQLPLAILVNGGSASASEIVSGCLQDSTSKGLCRAVIVGEQTFGKGSVQSILQLQDGSALRLTTAKYFTPSHKVIHEKGITPDITVPMSEEEEQDLYLRRAPGGLESLEPKDRERAINTHDTQLERAMDLLKGLTLYNAFSPTTDAAPRKMAKARE